jgi:hypothetical protein
MNSLVLHPECTTGPITSVTCDLVPTSDGCRAEFRIHGDIAAIKVPEKAAAKREDFLWKTTCFEIFWQPDGGSWYREFNLSPSTKWACYDFDDFRENSRDAPVEVIIIACVQNDNELVLRASITAKLLDPAKVALNAIVEDLTGNIQFWALAFQDGKPEFHSEVCRQLRVERSA